MADLKAWVETLDDQQRFHEHKVTYKDEDDPNHWKDNGLLESYLEVEEGQVILRPEVYNTDLQVAVKIDGRIIPGIAMLGGERRGEISTMLVDTGLGMEEADLAFAALDRTDDDNQVEISGTAITQLSKIELVVRQGTYKVNTGSNLFASNPKVGTVHETEKKAVNARAIQRALTYTFAPQDIGSLVCRLIWTYHTRTQLQIMGIIKEDTRRPMQERRNTNTAPAPPTSASRSLKRDPGTPVRRVVDEAKRTKLETLRKIKKEKSDRTRPEESQNQPVFFSESSAKGLANIIPGDIRMIIDMTGDSD